MDCRPVPAWGAMSVLGAFEAIGTGHCSLVELRSGGGILVGDTVMKIRGEMPYFNLFSRRRYSE